MLSKRKNQDWLPCVWENFLRGLVDKNLYNKKKNSLSLKYTLRPRKGLLQDIYHGYSK